MTNPIADPGHGHSPAAWTGVLTMLVGLSIAAVALFLWIPVALIVGSVIFVLGPILGWILSKAGFGVNSPRYASKAH